MCKNMACVTEPARCHIDLTQLSVLQLESTVNPYQDFEYNFVFQNIYAVTNLKIPRGGLLYPSSENAAYLYFDSQTKIRTNPVPSQSSYVT